MRLPPAAAVSNKSRGDSLARDHRRWGARRGRAPSSFVWIRGWALLRSSPKPLRSSLGPFVP